MVNFAQYDLATAKANSFDVLPAGEYPCVIVDLEEKPTKDGTGKRLNVKLQVISGSAQNRTILDGFNVVNKSPKAQEIGRGQLKAMCIAAGSENPKTSQELIGKKVVVKVKVKPDDSGNDRNEVTSYKAFVQPSATPAAAKAPNLVEQAFSEGEPAAAAKANPWA